MALGLYLTRGSQPVGKLFGFFNISAHPQPQIYNTILVCLSVWFFGQGSGKSELELSLAFFWLSFEAIDNDDGLVS